MLDARSLLSCKGIRVYHKVIESKYGKNSFKIELIKNDAKNFQELAQQEIDEIKKRGTISDGYNISAGGNLSGVKPIAVDGILYGSRAAAAEAFGIPQSKFNHRLKVGSLQNRPQK